MKVNVQAVNFNVDKKLVDFIQERMDKLEKYYDKKARKQGAKRICASPKCNTQLSRYNESKFCAECSSKEEEFTNKKFLQMIS